jgi:hypothetical protein
MTPREIVDAQAEDVGLWFKAQTAPEAYLQQELRRLHAAIERDPAVPVSALRALVDRWKDDDDSSTDWFTRDDCADELAALCDAAEGTP